MLCKRSAPSLHLNATQGVGCCSLKATGGILGPWKNIGNAAMEDFTPHVVVKIPKTNFPRGQRHFELFKRLAAMFQLVPSSIAFCIFSPFWRELGKDFQELICENRLWLLHFSISSSSCWVIREQFWALPQILSVTWGKVAYSLSSLVFQSWSPADNASFLLCRVLSTETISSKRGSLLQGRVCSVPTTQGWDPTEGSGGTGLQAKTGISLAFGSNKDSLSSQAITLIYFALWWS